jgi:hypothetical protein
LSSNWQAGGVIVRNISLHFPLYPTNKPVNQ